MIIRNLESLDSKIMITNNTTANLSNIKSRRALISEFLFNYSTKDYSFEKGLCNNKDKISNFLVLHKKTQRLIYLNLGVLMIIIISYFYLIFKFVCDFYNLINIIQDGNRISKIINLK